MYTATSSDAINFCVLLLHHPEIKRRRRGNGEIMTKEGNYVIETLNVAKLNLNRFPEITFRVSSIFRSLGEHWQR